MKTCKTCKHGADIFSDTSENMLCTYDEKNVKDVKKFGICKRWERKIIYGMAKERAGVADVHTPLYNNKK